MKFEIQKRIHLDVSLGDNQKKALKELGKRLELKKFNEDELFEEFYNICKEFDLHLL